MGAAADYAAAKHIDLKTAARNAALPTAEWPEHGAADCRN